jgi:hypothetical protein
MQLVFANISNAPVIEKDKSETYYVIADANSNTFGPIDLTATTT